MGRSKNNLEYRIEQASWRDLGALRKIEKECFPVDAWPIFDMIAVLTFSNIVRLKAVVDDQVVGFVAGEIRSEPRIGWIATIAVLPEFQRNGIARRLLHECEVWLNVDRFRLSVRTGNSAAIQLYEEFGYRRIGQWRSYYQDGSDAIVYEKWRKIPL